MSRRTDRVAETLRAELSAIIRDDVRDPRVSLATVSTVLVSRDLGHAQVMVSVLGEEEAREACIEALQRAKGFVRSQLARRVQMRSVPDLVFKLDRGAEHSQHMTDLLERLDVDRDS